MEELSGVNNGGNGGGGPAALAERGRRSPARHRSASSCRLSRSEKRDRRRPPCRRPWWTEPIAPLPPLAPSLQPLPEDAVILMMRRRTKRRRSWRRQRRLCLIMCRLGHQKSCR